MFTMPARLKTLARSAEEFARRVLTPRAYMESTFAPFYAVFRQDTWGLETVGALNVYFQKRRAIARNVGPAMGKLSMRLRQTKVRDWRIELRSLS